MQWKVQVYKNLTYAKHCRVHHRFGHPQVEKLYSWLKQLEAFSFDDDTTLMLERSDHSFEQCQDYDKKPRLFHFML